jgi:2-polyprenyl-3-methyl-5-hydroxy-6-metoxy-1,4-benzoquinol methylase
MIEKDVRGITTVERQAFFATEHSYHAETGYPERNTTWFCMFILPDVLRQIPDHQSKSLLDVGCATGYFTRLLAPHFGYTEGIDFVAERIEYARKFESDRLHFTQADLTKQLNLARHPDVLFTNAVIPHIPLQDKIQVFDNLAVVARPGAILLMYDGKAANGVVDSFCGLVSSGWIRENVKSWKLVSVNHIIDGAHRFVLTKV